MRHKYADLIHAWAEGAELEFLAGGDRWIPAITHPNWEVGHRYRLKPKTKTMTLRYRRYLCHTYLTKGGMILLHRPEHPNPEESYGFIKWIDDDWQEVTVEVPDDGAG